MSKTKFTPGPWETQTAKASNDVGIWAPESHPNVLAECFCELRHPGEDAGDEARANAHLIAAAPDLHAMCVVTLDLVQHFEKDPQTEWLCKELRRVIAIANGEDS